MTETRPFEDAWEPPADDAERFVVDLAGFEGPLDVLLELARRQKVDLTRISILALADQYLAFIAELRTVRLDIAADYLVMAAWLAYLKSRLLLPPEEQEEPSAEEMAEALAFRLQRLEAMRGAAERLVALPRLGQDVFARGAPEGVPIEKSVRFEATLFELLSAYAEQKRRREVHEVLRIRPPRVITIEESLMRLRRLVPDVPEWEALWRFLPATLVDAQLTRSAVASTLVAGLELARQGSLQLRQLAPFGPIYVRRSTPA
jgi:segregation and condensation protein A